MRKALNGTVAILLASTMLLAGNTRLFAHSAHAGMKTLRLYYMEGEAHWTHTLDPAYVTDATSYDILNMNQANLVKLLPSGQVGPSLAYKWATSRDHRTYWFYLRKGLRFSNGDPLTAEDAAFSITRSLAKATGSPVGLTYLGHILGATKLNEGKTNRLQGLKVLNSTTLQIQLDKHIAFFLKTLTYPTADVLDPRIIRGKKPDTYMTTTCAANVGAGPFVFQCRNKSTSYSSFYPTGSTPTMTMVPNPYYYGRKPSIMVKLPVIPSDQVNYREYKAGGVDTSVVPTADIARERGHAGYFQFPSSTVEYLSPDVTTKPFDNLHCRLAVAYAIDRDTIANKILHGSVKSTYAVVPSFMLGYYNGADSPHFNPTRAKAELKQCPGGIKNVLIDYASTGTDLDNEFAAIAAMLSNIGADVKPKKLTLNDWYNVVGQPLAKSSVKITDNGWIEDYPDPQDYLTNLLHSGANYDISGWSNKDFDRLTDKADVDLNSAERARLYIQAQKIAIHDGAWITMNNAIGHALAKPNIRGLIGSAAYGFLVPVNDDWANVTIR